MPEFKDAGHRPHARHTGEAPTTKISRGPHALSVNLDKWGPFDIKVMNMYLQSNWGEDPMTYTESTAEYQKHGGHLPYVEKCFKGNTLAQILEGISFWFTIDGVCRPATHQIVRTRGAAFMQHGGRDNDWRHRGFSMPETVARMCEAELDTGHKHCITDFNPLARYVNSVGADDMREAVEDVIARCKNLYSAMVDAGIPWQDARRFLPMGMQTYIHGIYDYRVLQQTLANRLELIMDWEYNCVGQLMVRELRIHTPKMVWQEIKSASDKAMKAAFAGLDSWAPDGKYPATPEELSMVRAHRPEQNPFWILTEDALNGGPVEWIATDGTYPHDNPKVPKAYRP